MKNDNTMATLEDFMLFNACEDAREEYNAHQITEFPYQKQYWGDDDKSSSSYWEERVHPLMRSINY